MLPPRPVLAVPGAVAAGLATLAGQALYAAYRDLPSFEGSDPSGTFGDPSRPGVTVAAVGDSSITGPGLDDIDQCWIRVVARRLTARYHVRVVSLAMGGSRAIDVLDEQLEVLAGIRPDLAFFSVGTNDIVHGTPLRLLRRQIFEAVEALSASSRMVLVAGVGDLGSVPRALFPLSAILTRLSAVVDGYHREAAASVPNAVKVPMRELCSHAFRTRPEVFSPDLYHPGAAGHLVWADAAYPTFLEALQRLET